MNRQVTGGLKRGEEKRSKKKELVFASADRADFKEMMPGVSKAVLWGNSDIGPYGAFTKMVPGFDTGTHTHPDGVWLVVLQGAYLYKDAAGEYRVGISFVLIIGPIRGSNLQRAREENMKYILPAFKARLILEPS